MSAASWAGVVPRDVSGRAIGKGDADHLGHRKTGLSGGVTLRPFASMRYGRQGVDSQSPLAMIRCIIIWANSSPGERFDTMCLPSSRVRLFDMMGVGLSFACLIQIGRATCRERVVKYV